MLASASRRETSRLPNRATRPGSKSANAVRNASRLRRIVIQASPLWNASRQSFSYSPRSSCTGRPHSSSVVGRRLDVGEVLARMARPRLFVPELAVAECAVLSRALPLRRVAEEAWLATAGLQGLPRGLGGAERPFLPLDPRHLRQRLREL